MDNLPTLPKNKKDLDAMKHYFTVHFGHCRGKIEGLVAVQSKGQLDVEEVMQTTQIKAWKGLPYFRGEAKFETWVYRIALNQVFNYFNLKKRRPQTVPLYGDYGLENCVWDAPSDECNPNESLDFIERTNFLKDKVSAISPINRAAFLMRTQENMSYEAIAEKLEIKAGTLKSRISRAREALKIEYNKEFS
ncbi:MAG: sigma-70 family RNA polymerase sigma factor [Candidatus Kariarchaeaceae archaeon]